MLEGREADRKLDSVQSFGATVRAGELMGAACLKGRSSLILQHGIPRIANLSTVMTLAQKGTPGTSFTLDDVNRVPGAAMACQREPEDGVLKDGSRKAVRYTNVHKKPVAVWPDATLDIAQTVKDVDLDRPIPLDESVDIVSGGAILMKDGVDKKPADGCSRPDPATPTEGVTRICRSSRTVVGVDQQGRTLLVTVTGPLAPGSPAEKVDGAWFTEVTAVLKSLGAMDAINLDGGGSTTLLTRPIAEDTLIRESGLSDAGERAVFDTLYTGPGGYAVPPLPKTG